MTDKKQASAKDTKKSIFSNKDERKEIIKNTLIMFAITAIAGGLLGIANEVTKEPIRIMEQNTIDNAHKSVFNSAASFEEIAVDVDKMSEIFADNYSTVEIEKAYKALSSENELLGYVLEVNSHKGYGGDIIFSIGFTLDGYINKISITTISETAGLGMNAPSDLAPQFNGLSADETFVLSSAKTKGNEIDAISGATITSKAVVNGVNAALLYYNLVCMGGESNE